MSKLAKSFRGQTVQTGVTGGVGTPAGDIAAAAAEHLEKLRMIALQRCQAFNPALKKC